MRRREFISLLGGAATAWPLVRAEQDARIRRLGMATGIMDEAGTRARYAAFFAELAQLSFPWPPTLLGTSFPVLKFIPSV